MRALYERWSRVMEKEFNRLREAEARGEPTVLDPYGAENPGEFFAVATEAFFELPCEVQAKHSDLYTESQELLPARSGELARASGLTNHSRAAPSAKSSAIERIASRELPLTSATQPISIGPMTAANLPIMLKKPKNSPDFCGGTKAREVGSAEALDTTLHQANDDRHGVKLCHGFEEVGPDRHPEIHDDAQQDAGTAVRIVCQSTQMPMRQERPRIA